MNDVCVLYYVSVAATIFLPGEDVNAYQLVPDNGTQQSLAVNT